MHMPQAWPCMQVLLQSSDMRVCRRVWGLQSSAWLMLCAMCCDVAWCLKALPMACVTHACVRHNHLTGAPEPQQHEVLTVVPTASSQAAGQCITVMHPYGMVLDTWLALPLIFVRPFCVWCAHMPAVCCAVSADWLPPIGEQSACAAGHVTQMTARCWQHALHLFSRFQQTLWHT